MCEITTNNLLAVYEQLKDRYPVQLTDTRSLNEGYTINCPILIAQAHDHLLRLYECDGWFVLDVTDSAQTKGTHWHPIDVSEAAECIVEFMEGQSDYALTPFPVTSPIDFILDTDCGGDCDDMMALAYLVYAQRALKAHIRAVTQCNACPGGSDLIRLFFEHLGEPVPPIGSPVGNAKNYDSYCTKTLERFGDGEIREYPDAVTVLRRTLVESENAVLCAIGPMNNIAALLNSSADEISPLDGVSLVREKCAKVVVMAGGFVPGDDGRNIPEWNALLDISATQTLVRSCPVPLVFLPFEAGLNMLTGGPMMDKFGETTPLSHSFCNFADTREVGGRHSWDPATLVYAVEGCGDFFDESPRGTVHVDDEGRTTMTADANGLHSYLTIKPHNDLTAQQCKDRIAEYIDRCALIVYS